MAGFWTDLPMGRVVSLGGISADEIILALEPLPDDAPAIVTLRPSGPPAVPWSSFILDELDACARALFPAWLPGAEHVDGLAGLGLAAVRAIAARAAGEAPDHGPFLADLAARALATARPGIPDLPTRYGHPGWPGSSRRATNGLRWPWSLTSRPRCHPPTSSSPPANGLLTQAGSASG